MASDTKVSSQPVAPQRPKPEFLNNFTPTRYKRRLSPVSRLPGLSRMGEIWHTGARLNPSGQIIADRPPDINPESPAENTYAGIAKLVDETMIWLNEAGIRPWDRVAIMKANHLDITILAIAAARLGAVPATLAGSYGPEAAHPLIERLERPFLITDQEHIERCGFCPETVARLTERTISVDGADGRDDIYSLDEFKVDGPPVPVRMREFNEPQIITHTSGTTGIPKLVMHSAESVWSMGIVECERWPVIALRKEDVALLCDPFSHERMTTLMLAMATMTPSVLFVSDPEVPDLKELIAKYPPTVVEALPNIYLKWEPLAKESPELFRNVRLYVNSFDAIHTRTIRHFLNATQHRFPVWIQSWSQSEQGSLVFRPFFRRTVRKVGKLPSSTRNLGWPIPFYSKHRAVDPVTGDEVARGEIGLIEVRQPGRCLAYIGEQDRHDIKVNGDWWHTGDLGIIDRWGSVRLVDREIDRIPEGSAIDFEDALLDRLPTTTEVVILPRQGHLPAPVYSTEDDQPINDADWAAAVADMPQLDKPKHVKWEDFPRTGTWKIRRVALREQLFEDSKAIGVGTWT